MKKISFILTLLFLLACTSTMELRLQSIDNIDRKFANKKKYDSSKNPPPEKLIINNKPYVWDNESERYIIDIAQRAVMSSNIFTAVKNNDTLKLQKAISGGGDVNAKDKDEESPLHYAVEKRDKAMVKLLLKHNADINAKDKDEESPLHYAVEKRDKAIIKLLLKHNADINAKDKDEESPLHYAVEKRDKAIIKLLLKHNADINAKNENGWSPLHYAVKKVDKSMIKLLLKHNADINAKNKNGDTPLILAAWFAHKHYKKSYSVYKLLLRYKADPSIEDSDGKTAKQYLKRSLDIINFKKIYKQHLSYCNGVWNCHNSTFELRRSGKDGCYLKGMFDRQGTQLTPNFEKGLFTGRLLIIPMAFRFFNSKRAELGTNGTFLPCNKGF